jgi:hypothetical protein
VFSSERWEGHCQSAPPCVPQDFERGLIMLSISELPEMANGRHCVAFESRVCRTCIQNITSRLPQSYARDTQCLNSGSMRKTDKWLAR